ncbi:hypothetical protein E2C01_092810 [Portunus trituberculatus]|uniref:Uncharacterized protein n=1 Tax=Portunus trituberculatus TaxID=210409 RepID=A0A5B7JN34_PORTR|nr:hypothetical protein [Portunus trituberculatus]
MPQPPPQTSSHQSPPVLCHHRECRL